MPPNTQHQAEATCDLILTGTLLHHAEVRCKVLDGDGHTVPVLCIDVASDHAARMPFHAEKVYLPHERPLAEAHAKAMRKGRSVKVIAPLVGLKLIATNAASIELDPEAEAPAPDETPDLFRQEALL